MLQHTLAEQLRFNAASFPGRTALEVVGGPGLTYAEALDRTLVLATAIRERTDGSPTAILLGNVDFGHTSPLATFPIGGRASLTVGATSSLRLSDA